MLALLRPKHKCVDILFGFQWPAYEWSGEREKTDWVRDGKFNNKNENKTENSFKSLESFDVM